MSEIDVSAATEALNSAGGVETLMHNEARGITGPDQTQTAATPASDVQVQQQAGIQQAQDAQPVSGLMRDPLTGRWTRADQQTPVQTQQPQSTESFTQLDPNTLAPELQQFYKSMQADYTRKTQELAAQRSQYEQLGSLDEIQQAASIYQQLQDPSSWPQLHAELTEGMKAMGLTQAEAESAATDAIQQQQPVDLTQLDDPDLAPIKTAYEQLQNQLVGLQNQFQEQQQAQQREQLELAVMGEFQRQENVIRQTNPHYTDGDLEAIYSLSTSTQGNLLAAQQRYDAMFNDRLGRYLGGKQGVADSIPSLPGSSALSAVQSARPKDLDEGLAMALEAINQIEAGA